MARMGYVATCLFIVCTMGTCFAEIATDEDLDARIQYAFKNMKKTMALVESHKPDDDGKCRYKCPDGSERRPKPGHMPSKNGCISPKRMQIDLLYVPKMGKCCDAHDLCYDTCMAIKEECDEMMKDCLFSMCIGWKDNKKKKKSQKKNEDSSKNVNVAEGNKKTVHDNENKSNEANVGVGAEEEEEEITDKELEIRRKWPNMHAGCREAADAMLRHTTVLGCREYRLSQEKACRCGYRPQSEGGGLLSEPIPKNQTEENLTKETPSSVGKDGTGSVKLDESKIKEQKPPKKDDKSKSKSKKEDKSKSTQNHDTNKQCGSDTCSADSRKSKSQTTDSNRKADASRKSKEEL